ncbi:uncharacterized protein [Solanum lycopersicum]|uniref:uncharacterized protein n=1 Tax=Solanum lycopersicum TaxID=4081 RepID=UPI0002BC8E71|nr:uncharacterized protein LOC101252828 [Solanum lycopersicum]
MRASSLNKSSLFKVRKYIAQHTCSVREKVYARRQGITDIVVVLIMEKYIDPSKVYIPKDIADDTLKLHGVSLTYIQAWRAKEKAVKLVRGDPAECYARLPGYFYILEQTYPRSVLKIKRNEGDTFLYAFVALESCIRGWEYCRPIVVVDGVTLKCSYGGTMLTASTLDPGGHILPLAYAIFREAYGVRQNMCFMSDRNESIWKGTTNVYPESEHYECIWHLSVNVLKNFNRNTEDLKILFFSLAKAYTKQQFETIMGRIDQIDMQIRPYLFDIGYSKWSRAYSNCKRTWTMTSNIAESLNNVNRLARRLPVISLLEFIRVIPSTVDLHVVAEGAKKYIVNLNTRMCSCRRFQHYEIPCGHAIAVLRYRKLHEAGFCYAFYSLKNLKDVYAIPVEPIPCESTWDIPSYISDPKMMSPGPKRSAGRPIFERWKGFADVKFKRTKNTCSRCHQVGHNRKICSNYPVQK